MNNLSDWITERQQAYNEAGDAEREFLADGWNRAFKFRYGIGCEFLRFGQVVHVVKGFVFQPFQSVDLVIVLFDFCDREAMPAIIL